MTRELTQDAFLGGRLSIRQPKKGYRAGIDPVLLAATVAARAGEQVLELGCGVGVAALCLWARVPDVHVTGVERDDFYAGLASENAKTNAARLDVVTADLEALPHDLRQSTFDHVMMNPPYFDRANSSASPDRLREAALGQQTPLPTWVETGAKRLRPKGWLHVIHRADRLFDLAQSCVASGLGSLEIRMIHPRPGREANLVLLRARKGGRASPRFLMPINVHARARPGGRHDDYTPEILAVLRNGGALNPSETDAASSQV